MLQTAVGRPLAGRATEREGLPLTGRHYVRSLRYDHVSLVRLQNASLVVGVVANEGFRILVKEVAGHLGVGIVALLR